MSRPSLTLADTIDLIALGLMGLYALGCVLAGGSAFSDIHISIPGLSFPIFIGEIVMALCLGLLALRYKTKPIAWNKWQKALWAYWFLIIGKTLCDYHHWGPLAFRNGAMYYYAIFALMGSVFYHPRFFRDTVCVFIGLILIYITSISFDSGYYLYSAIILFAVTLAAVQTPLWRWILLALFLVFFNYHVVFAGSRTGLSGTLAAVSFLTVLFTVYFIRGHVLKWAVVVLAILVCLGGLRFFADKNAVKSCVQFEAMYKMYQEDEGLIKQRKPHFAPQVLPVALYHNKGASKSGVYAGTNYRESKEMIFRLRVFSITLGLLGVALIYSPFVPRKMQSFALIAGGLLLFFYCQYMEGLLRAPFVSSIQPLSINQPLKQVSPLSPEPAIEQRAPVQPVAPPIQYRSIGTAVGNAVFRIHIWQDMLDEVVRRRALFGVGFGEPQRSPSLEILGFGDEYWSKDGWITPHNFYFHILYRLGIIGLGLIVLLISAVCYVTRAFITLRSWQGIALMSIIVYWLMAASFLVILELPQYAIPFWSLAGLILGYLQCKEKHISSPAEPGLSAAILSGTCLAPAKAFMCVCWTN